MSAPPLEIDPHPVLRPFEVAVFEGVGRQPIFEMRAPRPLRELAARYRTLDEPFPGRGPA